MAVQGEWETLKGALYGGRQAADSDLQRLLR